jgi:beta-N-acetylhexosaminidase
MPSLTGNDPATFSRRALVGLLRDDFGFTGVVVTDALEMQGAAASAGSIPVAAVRSLAAGADLLCIGSQVWPELVEAIVAEILAAVRDGRLALSRLEEAAGRVAALAAWTLGHAQDEADPQLGYAAARRAVRVEGSVEGLVRPLIVQIESDYSIAEGRVPWGLGPHLDAPHLDAPQPDGPQPDGVDQLRVNAAETTVDSLVGTAGDRSIVVVGRHIHRTAAARTLVETLAKVHPVVVVEMGWPSAWRPAGARAFVVTYGASHANGRAAAEALGLTPQPR